MRARVQVDCEPPRARLRIDGELDLAANVQLRHALARVAFFGCHQVEIDLDAVTFVEAGSLPADVVAMDSTVILLDLESGTHDHYTLVLPSKADASKSLISVIAPLGTAVLGARVGDVMEWRMPGGLRRMRIEAVGRIVPAGETRGSAA